MTNAEGVVVDASVAVKWLVSEPDSDLAAELLQLRLHAPDLLFPECANILWKKVARGQLTVDVLDVVVDALQAVDVTIHLSRMHLGPAVALACRLDHPAYDCFYLALAEALEMPFVTADDRLVRTVRASGAAGWGELVQPLAEWA